jgi:hypothetical protein
MHMSVSWRASVPTHVTVDLPAENIEPLGGVQTIVTGSDPPSAVANGYDTLAGTAVVRTD